MAGVKCAIRLAWHINMRIEGLRKTERAHLLRQHIHRLTKAQNSVGLNFVPIRGAYHNQTPVVVPVCLMSRLL